MFSNKKKNKPVMHITIWMNLQGIKDWKKPIPNGFNTVYFHLYITIKMKKKMEMENRLEVIRTQGRDGRGMKVDVTLGWQHERPLCWWNVCILTKWMLILWLLYFYHNFARSYHWGVPGWLGQLSIWLLISVQVMILGSWDQAPRQAPVWSLLVPLPLLLPLLSLLSVSLINK